jgi:putative transposase
MDSMKLLSGTTSIQTACQALMLPRANYYRYLAPKPHRLNVDRLSPLSLTTPERQIVLDVLHSERFIDSAPAEIHATLLDEGTYVCSVRTMYRILQGNGEGKERRRQRAHHVYQKPELLAQQPNEVWSWDITRLKGPKKWTYYYLYVIMDIFSRFVVGWSVAHRESAKLAELLIKDSCYRQSIQRNQLTIHADRGSSMKSKPVAFLLADLGVTKSHSRPYQSNDNPYSESQFKTLKYNPGFPDRFGSIEDARAFSRDFFNWYNHEHRHSGIAMMTPASMHDGNATNILAKRNDVLFDAFNKNPNRFKYCIPKAADLPDAVWINKPKTEGNTIDLEH